MIALTPEQSRAIQHAGSDLVRLEDPETRRVYILLDAETFDLYRSWLPRDSDDGPGEDARAMYPLLAELDAEDGEDASHYGP